MYFRQVYPSNLVGSAQLSWCLTCCFHVHLSWLALDASCTPDWLSSDVPSILIGCVQVYFQRVLSSRSAGKAELLSYIAAVGKNRFLLSLFLHFQSLIWLTFCFLIHKLSTKNYFKGSDQRENRRVWSNINTRYLVWGCGDGRSFVL